MKKLFVAFATLLFIAVAFAFAGNPNPPNAKVFTTPTSPVNGTNEVQTLTFSGSISGGSFILSFNNRQTGAITWSATNGTLVSNIDVSLEALASIGSSGVVTAVGTMTAGIGTITVTFSGTKNAKLDVSQMIVVNNALTGAGALVAVTTTTPGVTADGRTSAAGTLDVAADDGSLWVNLGTSPNPTWTSLVAAP